MTNSTSKFYQVPSFYSEKKVGGRKIIILEGEIKNGDYRKVTYESDAENENNWAVKIDNGFHFPRISYDKDFNYVAKHIDRWMKKFIDTNK